MYLGSFFQLHDAILLFGQAAATVTVGGTTVPTAYNTEIVSGGETVLVTLGGDYWMADGTPFNAIRQDLIDGLDSAQSEAGGWNIQVRDNLPTTAVVRSNDQLVTITLTAQAGYSITAPETITVTVPASAMATQVDPLTGVPTFQIQIQSGVGDSSFTRRWRRWGR